MRTFTSVNKFVKQAEEQRVLEAMEEVRRPVLSVPGLIEGLKAQITSKVWWIGTYSVPGPKKRPDSEITSRRHELAVLVQSRDRLISEGAGAVRPPT
jgi:hypothetical protein